MRTLHRIRDILKDHKYLFPFTYLTLPFVTYSIVSSQLASVAFQFQRKGFVKVVLDKGENFDDHLEGLVETAFEVGAEDFFVGKDTASSDSVEIEVSCLFYSCPGGSPFFLVQMSTSHVGSSDGLGNFPWDIP